MSANAQNLDYDIYRNDELPVTVYKLPNGRTELITLPNLDPEDVAWFRENDYKVSLEQNRLGVVLYVDCGLFEDDGETPWEIIHIAPKDGPAGKAITDLRAEAEKVLKRNVV